MSFAIQSGILVPVTCAVRRHVRNSLLFRSQIHSEQGKPNTNQRTRLIRVIFKSSVVEEVLVSLA